MGTDTNMVQKDGIGAVPKNGTDIVQKTKKSNLQILLIVLAVLGGGLLLAFVVGGGILAAIAVPNFVKARKTAQTHACIDNMRQIDGAIEQSLMDGTTPSSVADLCGAYKYIKTEPKCPSVKNGASYRINPGGDPQVICPNVGTFPDHVLPSYNW